MNRMQLARLLDHTLVAANATQADITALCDEAVAHGIGCVAVNSVWAPYCARSLSGKGVTVCACVGFPLGAATARVKTEEAREAVRYGAAEIEMVISIGALRSGFPDFVEKEIAMVVKGVPGVPVKAILETGFLTDAEKDQACRIAVKAGAAFVSTATGYGRSGATVDDVRIMRRVVGNRIGVKAAGGIRSYAEALHFLQAGATRIGSSAGVAILDEAPER